MTWACVHADSSVVGLLLTLAMSTLTRMIEADADSLSMALANKLDGLARILIKTAEHRVPPPSVATRIRGAQPLRR